MTDPTAPRELTYAEIDRLSAELQDALSAEGYKDYRIEALEAALDWAMLAVFTHYSEGEAPAVSGAFEEIEKSRVRFLAECKRLSEARAEAREDGGL